jgi:hypothetical protein
MPSKQLEGIVKLKREEVRNMNDKLSKWVTALEDVKNNILNTLHYNGLVLDDLDNVIKDMKETQGE